mmetsp:Transcript_14841/g.39433  ORF Transcript_14841/g.39433 Transcript_14841/m.39433 type:complete len:286 (+) Transcript_14841:313-1170(+)
MCALGGKNIRRTAFPSGALLWPSGKNSIWTWRSPLRVKVGDFTARGRFISFARCEARQMRHSTRGGSRARKMRSTFTRTSSAQPSMSAVYALWSDTRTSSCVRMRPRWVSRPWRASPWLSEECCSKLMYLAIFSRKLTASSRKACSILVAAARPSCASACAAFTAMVVSRSCPCAHSLCSCKRDWKKLISCLVTSCFICRSPRSASSRAASWSWSSRRRSTSARRSVWILATFCVKSLSKEENLARSILTISSSLSLMAVKVFSLLMVSSSYFVLTFLSFSLNSL